MKSRGLGDDIAKFTSATGIKAIVETIFPDDKCGCKKRQEQLNKLVSYGKQDTIEE